MFVVVERRLLVGQWSTRQQTMSFFHLARQSGARLSVISVGTGDEAVGGFGDAERVGYQIVRRGLVVKPLRVRLLVMIWMIPPVPQSGRLCMPMDSMPMP